jgi:hypothetical protein
MVFFLVCGTNLMRRRGQRKHFPETDEEGTTGSWPLVPSFYTYLAKQGKSDP